MQCKFRQDSNKIISWDSLSTFFGLSFGVSKNIIGGYFVTNTFDLCDEVYNTDKVIPIYGNYFDNLSQNFFNNICKSINKQKIEYICKNPFDFQLECINNVYEHLQINKKCNIEMSCGSGKTLTSYWIDKKLNNKLSIVFVPSLYLLSQFYVDWVNQSYAENVSIVFLLIGSDADIDDDLKYKINGINITTDSDKIEKFIEDNKDKKIVVISTYQSADKITNNIKFNFGIFDESHKTVGLCDKKFSYALDNENIKIRKKLFMTATPKIYYKNVDKKDDDSEESNDKIISMDNIDIYGKQIYQYNTGNAINDNRLVDYQLMTILATNEEIDDILKKNKIIKLKDDFDEYESNYIGAIIIILKLFNENKINHLLTYHNTLKRAKKFTEKIIEMNEKIYNQEININYLDGSITMSKRNKIINDFKNNKKSIICSAKVLNEGVNIPIIDSVCFMDVRNSTIDIVQCIGRSLRKYEDKKKAYIILPTILEDLEFSETKFETIIRILKALKAIDEYITEYFKEIHEGNKPKRNLIKTERLNKATTETEKVRLNELKNSISEKLWKIVNNWEYKLEKVKEYIDKNKKRPSYKDKNKKIRIWIDIQQYNYSRKQQIMKDSSIRRKWKNFIEEYKDYLKSNTDIWNDILEKVKQYINKNKKLPSRTNNDDKKMSNWISRQEFIYYRKQNIMKNEEIRRKWTMFIEEYKDYFKSNKKIWYETLYDVKKYIDGNKCKPSNDSKSKKNIKMNKWISHQQENYSKKQYVMKDNEIRTEWKKFIEAYTDFFKSSENIWKETLKKVKEYIDKNNKKPTNNNKDEKIKKIGLWIITQKINYSKKQKIMRNDMIRDKWEKFINEYCDYFKSKEEIWHETLEKIKKYIDENNKKPSRTDKNKEIKKWGTFIQTQKTNYSKKRYIMKNDEIRKKWEKFIDDYEEYFKK